MIRRLQRGDAPAVARLHCSALTGLVADLGVGVAELFYAEGAEAKDAHGFVAVDGDRLNGFVFGSLSPRSTRQSILAGRPLRSAIEVALGVVRNPRALPSVIDSMGTSAGNAYDPGAPELTYIAVAPHARGHGVGQQLVRAFTDSLREEGAPSFELSVDEDNSAAIAFYARLGFARVGTYVEFGRTHFRYRMSTGEGPA